MALVRRAISVLESLEPSNIKNVFGVVYRTRKSRYLAPGYCTSAEPANEPESSMIRAVRIYKKRFKESEEFMKQQIEEFENGRKFLAKIMGKKLSKFNEPEIDKAIKYLFPSGLYEPKARPMMKHPYLIFEKMKEREFDEEGRPYHYLFYSRKPKYTELLHNLGIILNSLNDKLMKETTSPKPMSVGDTIWISKKKLEQKLGETLLDVEYNKFIDIMELILSRPFSYEYANEITQYREPNPHVAASAKLPKVVEKNGVYHVGPIKCGRKRCKGTVTVSYPGTGKIEINGHDIVEFYETIQPREQVRMICFPHFPNADLKLKHIDGCILNM